jgi:hypothetical protein
MLTGFALFFDVQYKLYLANPKIGISKDRLKTAVEKGYITAEDYKTITGEDYSE